MYFIYVYIASCIASEVLFVNHLYSAPSPSLAVQAGFRTRHITTFVITAACRNATHSANLRAKVLVYLIFQTKKHQQLLGALSSESIFIFKARF